MIDYWSTDGRKASDLPPSRMMRSIDRVKCMLKTVRVDLWSQGAGVLVLMEAYCLGCRATVNGYNLKIQPVHDGFRRIRRP